MDQIPKTTEFVFPQVLGEMGEIERVADHIGEPRENVVRRFLKATLPDRGTSEFGELSDAIWAQLKNTDSVGIERGEWAKIESLMGTKRDWKSLKRKMETGQRVDAPIIAILPSNEYHTVSGNTRLMVAKALGIRPKVLIVDLRIRTQD